MTRWYVLDRTSARYHLPKPVIVQHLAEQGAETDIEFDADELTGTLSRLGVINLRYRWEVTPDNGAYRVSEERCMSRWWVAGLAVGVMGVAIWLGEHAFPDIVPYGIFFSSFVGLVTLPGLLNIFMLFPAPRLVKKTRAYNEGTTTMVPLTPVIALLLVFSLLGAFAGVGLVQAGAILGIVGLAGLLLFRYEWFVTFTELASRKSLLRPPGLVLEYIMTVGVGAAPTAISIIMMENLLEEGQEFLDLMGEGHVNLLFRATMPYVGLAWLLIILSLYTFQQSVSQRSFGYYEMRSDQRRVTSLVRGVVFVLIAAGGSYGLVYLCFIAVDRYQNVLSGQFGGPLSAVHGFTVGLAALPLLYFVVGLGLQTTTFVWQAGSLWLRSTPATVSTTVSIDPDVRVLQGDGAYVGSYSLGHTSYIFISRSLVDALSRPQLAAVLAHEEAHIKHRDALVSFVVPLLSVVLLTGRNVIYSVLDFRGREFAADAYAARKTDPDQVIDVLETIERMDELDAPRRGLDMSPAFNPFSGRYHTGNWFERGFGLFYGGFALAEIHPSITERIAHVRTVG